VFTLIDEQPKIAERAGAKALVVASAALRFDNVSFGYGGAGQALREVSFTVGRGETVALVGPSGAGKTTIFNLIPRLFDVTGGAVTIDGQDVRAVTLASLRGAIALVSQDVALFNDSVRANIAFGRPGASDADIIEAAKAAAAHEFIEAMPQGYDTLVGERGGRLSGGERQRLSLARAFLRDAPILLLDEATSALDADSERRVQEALARLAKGRTTLAIAHRLATVRDADRIIVLENGAVRETGRHDELVAKGGLYARLARMQFHTENAPV
jgi:subfamily B ATP-binding cassette protein MsbA